MERKYVYTFNSPLGEYTAQAYFLRCYDDRFWKAFKHFVRDQNFSRIDQQVVAGGAKVLSSPEKEGARDFILREIAKSISLHHTSRAMLFTHYDCGAYGGLAKFNGDKDAEFVLHQQEHKKAREIVQERFPELEVETYFIDAKGVIKTSA